MSDLRPLRETSQSEFDRALLRSADRDAPSPLALRKTAAALGVTLGLTGATAGTASAATATFWAVVGKPLIIGAASGLFAAAVGQRVMTPTADERPAVSSSAVTAASARAPVEPAERALPAPPPEPDDRAEQGVSQPAPRPANPRGALLPSPVATERLPVTERSEPRTASSSAGSPAVSTAEEVQSIDRARLALREGRAEDSLRELERYRRSWPNGVLAIEAGVLRIEAHLAIGDRAWALDAARAFLNAHPSGPYATRVRALFGGTPAARTSGTELRSASPSVSAELE